VPAAIETRRLARSFGEVQALRSLDLVVRPGEVYGFLGLNGAGKSTTLKMLTTLLKPTGGSAAVGGHDVVTEPLAVRRSIGVLGEFEGAPQPSWTPEEYLRTFAALRGMPRAEGRRKASALLDRLGLGAWGKVPVGTFSSGMKRKVELARALLHDPAVLFLDEPTRELDLPSKADIWKLLHAAARERRATVFLCSHDVLEVEELCDRVGVVWRGRLAHEAPLHALAASNVVRIETSSPERALAAAKALAGVREAWREDGAVRAALAPGARASEVLRELVVAGVPVDSFAREQRLAERLASLMQHGGAAA
jgi:ABC-2 type transport system ATP-binding protein